MNGPCCACMRVKYEPEHLSNGAMRERWVCVDCGMEFVKRGMIRQEFQRIESDIRSPIDGAATVTLDWGHDSHPLNDIPVKKIMKSAGMQPGETRTFKLVEVPDHDKSQGKMEGK